MQKLIRMKLLQNAQAPLMEIKTNPDSSCQKRNETSGTQTNSPAIKRMKRMEIKQILLRKMKIPVAVQLAALKEEAMQRNENSSIEKENKNNQNQLKKNQK